MVILILVNALNHTFSFTFAKMLLSYAIRYESCLTNLLYNLINLFVGKKYFQATYCPHLPTQTQLPLLDSSKVNAQISQELVALSEKKALSDVTCYKAS